MNNRKSNKYDKLFYGELASIKDFKKTGSDITLSILAATGGQMKGVKKDAAVLWKPNSRIYTKEFAKRFPKLEDSESMKEVKKKDIENEGFI